MSTESPLDADASQALDAISPYDGRYHGDAAVLSAHFSERALIRTRAEIEIDWLAELMPLFEFSRVHSPESLAPLRAAIGSPHMAVAVKQHEKTARHDVKAVEYWLGEQLGELGLSQLSPLVHFACTSWDINNIAQAKMVRGAVHEVLLPQLAAIESALVKRAHDYADIPMLSRTHGQAASPTTMGKEFANFAVRVQSRHRRLAEWQPTAKMNGAVGCYNAHMVARPDIDWAALSQRFIEAQGMRFATHTTQIEPYDDLADLFNLVRGINTICLDFCRDMWGYIAIEYFVQQKVADEVGSSTMPHKINPIDFENAEGNIGVANALFSHFADKLPVSRWQRDLSDSTVLRSIGAAFAHSFLAWRALVRGVERAEINRPKLAADLDANWQVLTEAVQTVLRAENAVDDAYTLLKQFSRGAEVSRERLHAFIRTLPIGDAAKERLLTLTPGDYCGLAAQLAKQVAEQPDEQFAKQLVNQLGADNANSPKK